MSKDTDSFSYKYKNSPAPFYQNLRVLEMVGWLVVVFILCWIGQTCHVKRKSEERVNWVNSISAPYVVVETFYPPFNLLEDVGREYPEFELISHKVLSSGKDAWAGSFVICELTLIKNPNGINTKYLNKGCSSK